MSIYSVVIQHKYKQLLRHFYDDLAISLDVNQSFEIASLKQITKHKSLSIGDRACIALGIRMKLPIYTADKIWTELDIEGAEIVLIR